MYDKLQKQLHGFAEPGYQEYKSAALLEAFLEDNDFPFVRAIREEFESVKGTDPVFVPLMGERKPPLDYRK